MKKTPLVIFFSVCLSVTTAFSLGSRSPGFSSLALCCGHISDHSVAMLLLPGLHRPDTPAVMAFPPPTSSNLKLHAPLSARKVAGVSHKVQRARQFLNQPPGLEGVAVVETGVLENRDAVLETRLPDHPQAPGPSGPILPVQDLHGSESRMRKVGTDAEWMPT